jgi:glycosyltransferase involved in cell wall biosynthesis
VKVLHLSNEPSSITGLSGGSARQYHLLKRLVARGAAVKTVAPALASRLEESDAERACTDAGIEFIPVSRDENRLREAAHAIVKDPRVLSDLLVAPFWGWRGSVFWSSLSPVAQRIVDDWEPDVILIDGDYLAHWGSRLRADVPLVLLPRDATWDVYAKRAASATGTFTRLRMKVEMTRFRRHVRRHLNSYDQLVVPAPEDKARFRELVDVPIAVIPSGTDCQAIQTTEEIDPWLVSFIGTLNYGPNVEGISWFCEQAWPLVRHDHPEARLEIVGRDPSARVLKLDSLAGVTVVGSVPSVLPQLSRSAVLIAPLLSGGGTKLKVVEAFAARRPLVATSVAMTGIEATESQHLLRADDAPGFAAAVNTLLEDPALRQDLAAAARTLAESKYDWSTQGDLLFGALTEITTRG